MKRIVRITELVVLAVIAACLMAIAVSLMAGGEAVLSLIFLAAALGTARLTYHQYMEDESYDNE